MAPTERRRAAMPGARVLSSTERHLPLLNHRVPRAREGPLSAQPGILPGAACNGPLAREVATATPAHEREQALGLGGEGASAAPGKRILFMDGVTDGRKGDGAAQLDVASVVRTRIFKGAAGRPRS